MRTPVALHRLCQRISINDVLIVAVLLFLCVDLRHSASLASFDTCRKPIHMWLFGTYLLLSAFRVAALCLPAAAPREQELDLILPLKHFGPWAMLSLFAWNVLGSHWLYSIRWSQPLRLGDAAGGCLADSRKYVFILSWQVAIYAVLFIHGYIYIMSSCQAKRMQNLLDNLRALEDEDSLSRWGPQRPHELSASEQGLSPNEILELPQAQVALADQESECSICLSCVHTGDSVRSLDKCGHTFHRACIDLWLLRRASCPLCKTSVGEQLAARSCLV